VFNNHELGAQSQVAKANEHVTNKHEQLCKSRKLISYSIGSMMSAYLFGTV